MRLENTDRFKNKFCRVIWKDGFEMVGVIRCVPNYSAKYNYHLPGWFLVQSYMEFELKFKDLKEIIVEEDED